MSDKRSLRILREHNSDGTHNAAASTTLKTLLPASATPAASTIPIANASGKFSITSAWFYYFESAAQTITSAGALTLAHGFGVIPTLVQVWLKCLTAEYGYSINDVTLAPASFYTGTYEYGVTVIPDATNLNVRYALGSGGTVVFVIPNKTTGAACSITLANWKAIFRAWA